MREFSERVNTSTTPVKQINKLENTRFVVISPSESKETVV